MYPTIIASSGRKFLSGVYRASLPRERSPAGLFYGESNLLIVRYVRKIAFATITHVFNL